MRYFVILVLVNLMWAFQFSGAKLAMAQLGPITVAFLPLAMSTLLLAPFIVLERRRRDGQPAGRPRVGTTILQFAVLGTAGTIAAQLFLVWGVQRSLASNAAVINLTIPVLTAVIAAVLLQERMTRLRWISFALAIAGVLLVSDMEWRSLQIFHGKYLFGNFLIFLSCCGSAFYNTYSKKLLRRFAPSEVLVYSFIVADLILLALMLKYEPVSWARLAALESSVWFSLLIIAVFSLSFSMMLFLWVIKHIDVTQASLSIYLLPVFGVILSNLTLREKLTLHLVIGGFLVFLSTFLVTIYEGRTRRREEIARAA
ncbi:MAG TPA: DMT family transporter [Acidobacteriota bacterium]|jgi:drug/metabolite transporter (DMT)-like permease